jgi:hypothetical protein
MKYFSFFKSGRRLLLYIASMICVFFISACDEEEPDSPIQPMYGVPSGDYSPKISLPENGDSSYLIQNQEVKK